MTHGTSAYHLAERDEYLSFQSHKAIPELDLPLTTDH